MGSSPEVLTEFDLSLSDCSASKTWFIIVTAFDNEMELASGRNTPQNTAYNVGHSKLRVQRSQLYFLPSSLFFLAFLSVFFFAFLFFFLIFFFFFFFVKDYKCKKKEITRTWEF